MITTEYDDTNPAPPPKSLNRPRPMQTLVAAAQRLTSRQLKSDDGKVRSTAQQWQEDAWDMYDLVGEQRFLSTTLAGRLSQARLYVGRLPEDPTEHPEPIEDGKPALVWESFGNGNPAKVAQLIARLGVNLFVAGDGWLVGTPKRLIPNLDGNHPEEVAEAIAARGEQPNAIIPLMPGVDADADGREDLTDLDWRMLSVTEVTFEREERVTLKLGETKEEWVSCSPDEVFLIRVWRPHPRKSWQADSPTRASLPVLRELVGLTMHVSAQVDSRLAGAGVLLVPQSASDAIKRQSGQTDETDDSDPFTEALIEAMITPINDRSSASAYVPFVVTVPDESVESFKHISFASPLDSESRELRDEAIRRLALGQDAPPEILLGTGGMNHWGAWLVREDTITTHIEPPLALICDALTSQFLHPILIDQGMSEEEAEQYVVWYDVDHLIARPNRTADAQALYDAGVLSAKSLRDAAGFGDTDAPPAVAQTDPAVAKALELVTAAPSLAQAPGLPALVEQIRNIMSGSTEEVPATPVPVEETPAEDDAPAAEGPPEDTGTGPEEIDTAPDEIAAGAARPDLDPDLVKGPFLSPEQASQLRSRVLQVTHGGGN